MAKEDNIQRDTSKSAEDHWVGRTVGGKYHIIERLGTGGAGAVYRAEHMLMERIVALKVLHAHLASAEEFLNRFKREAMIASKLTHPNLITLYDFGIEDGAPYLVMEFVRGTNLKDVLIAEGALEIHRAAEILKQIVAGIGEAHSKGIIHRDLKPDNIMVERKEDGTECIRILDFGIAKPTGFGGQNVSTTLTSAGTFVGTPQYMSPEQALSREIDARSDIYSLGIILYEMLTGRVPFQTNSPMELLVQHINAVPPEPREIKADGLIKENLSKVILKALAKTPEERQQSVKELAAEFFAAVKATGELPEKPKRSSTRSFPLAYVSIAVFVLIVGFGTAYLAGMPASESEQVAKVEQETVSEEVAVEPQAAVVVTEDVAAEEQVESDILPEQSQELAVVAIANEVASELLPGQSEETVVVAVAEQELAGGEDLAVAEDAVVDSPIEEPAEKQIDITVVASLEQVEVIPEQPLVAVVAPITDVPTLLAGITALKQLPTVERQRGSNQAAELTKRGRELFEKGDQLNAAIAFVEALRKKDDYLIARVSLGSSLIKLGESAAAIEQLRIAEAIDANYAPTHYHLARAYAELGSSAEAITELQRAIKLYPKIRDTAAKDESFKSIAESAEFQALVQ